MGRVSPTFSPVCVCASDHITSPALNWRRLGPIPELTRIWRLLTRPQLRRTPRVAAFFDFMVGEIEALRPIITG